MLNALAQAQTDKVAAQAEVDKLANSSVNQPARSPEQLGRPKHPLRLTTQTATALPHPRPKQRRCRLGRG